MSFRLVPKSMTLNDLERRNGSYFALFHRIWCARIELIDEKSTSIIHRAVQFASATKCKDFSVTYFNLSFKFRFTVAFVV